MSGESNRLLTDRGPKGPLEFESLSFGHKREIAGEMWIITREFTYRRKIVGREWMKEKEVQGEVENPQR